MVRHPAQQGIPRGMVAVERRTAAGLVGERAAVGPPALALVLVLLALGFGERVVTVRPVRPVSIVVRLHNVGLRLRHN